eukprot:g15049.t1
MGNALGCCVPAAIKEYQFPSLNIRFTRKKKEEKALRSAGAELDLPFEIDWSTAKRENWKFESLTGPGRYFFKFQPEIEQISGSIAEGEAKLKSQPELYEGMMYQTNMKDLRWLNYKLVKRTGSGYRFTPEQPPSFTFLEAKYQALEHHSKITLDPDQYTDGMTFRGQRLGKACHPGRGQGVCDVPHIKIIGEIHPNEPRLRRAGRGIRRFDGSGGVEFNGSAISALSEFEGAIAKLFKKTPNIKALPKNQPQKYVVTLYESWVSRFVVLVSSLPSRC